MVIMSSELAFGIFSCTGINGIPLQYLLIFNCEARLYSKALFFSRFQSPGKTMSTFPHFEDGTQGKLDSAEALLSVNTRLKIITTKYSLSAQHVLVRYEPGWVG